MTRQPTRILILGGGAREHALAWKLAARARHERGRRGAGLATAIAAEPRVRSPAGRRIRSDPAAVVAAARARAAELVVIGPEAPLAAGRGGRPARGRASRSFGPTRAAARIETLEGVLSRRRRGGRGADGPCPRVRGGEPERRRAYVRELAAPAVVASS